jgi:predicted RNA binding protein YcfA (HicA-like mRNA interferase family)
MASLPVLKPIEVCRLLEKAGFAAVRQRGSHIQYRHADGRGTTVPIHKGRDIAPSLLRKIARDIGLTPEELVQSR